MPRFAFLHNKERATRLLPEALAVGSTLVVSRCLPRLYAQLTGAADYRLFTKSGQRACNHEVQSAFA
jgi:hypothetical protein